MKKYFGLFALLLCTSTAWAVDFTADDINGNTINYNIIDADALEVEVAMTGSSSQTKTKYSGDIVIPETVDYDGKTYTVTTIGEGAFYYAQSTVTSLQLPKTITTICEYAFAYYCDTAKSFCGIEGDEEGTLRIPANITTLYDYAFYQSKGFTRIYIEDSTEPLEHICTSSTKGAFRSCSGVTSLYWGRNITWTDSYCPWRGLSFSDVEIRDKVTHLPAGSFYGLTFTEFEFPENITSVDADYLFYNCSNLKSVELPDCVDKVGYSMFYGCSALEDVYIPEGVTTFDYRAFYNCTSLKTITIPSTVTSLGQQVFYGNSNLSLETIVSLNPEPPTGDTNVFGKVSTSTCVLKVPEGSKDKYSSASYWSSFTNIEELEALDDGDKFEIDGITYDVVSKDNKSIAVTTQEGEYSGSITIPEKVTYNYITYTVTSIGASTFANCTQLIEVTIPTTVETIGDSAFSGCTALERIFEQRTTPPTLGTDVFKDVPSTCWLIVDYEAKGAYTSADQWGDFSTIVGLYPVVTTQEEVADITRYTATLSATYELGYNETTEKGFEYWTANGQVLTAEATISAEGDTMTASLEDLSAGTSYTFRAYVKATDYSQYGEEYTFTTEHIPPTVATTSATDVTSTSVVLNGSVEVGTEDILEQGFKYWTSDADVQDAIVENGEEEISITLTDLAYGTDYSYYAYATTESGTITGETFSFTTLIDAPTVQTYAATNITDVSALVKGYVSMGSEEILEQGFEYWAGEYSEENVETIVCADEVIAITLTGLSSQTTYTYRAFATTERLGTTYGDDFTFTTDVATGINGISLDSENVVGIYSVGGQKIEAPQKGVNIIRYTDGTVKKIYVK